MKYRRLTIRRSKWARVVRNDESSLNIISYPKGASKLLNMDGGMCCLGFDCLNLHKIPAAKLLGVDFPWYCNLPCSLSRDDARTAAYINDSARILPHEKEEALRVIFKKNGIKLRFVD